MDPIVFELLGGLLVGGMVWLTIVRRPKSSSSQAMPVLAVKRARTVSSSQRRRTSTSKRAKTSATSHVSSDRKKRVRAKTVETTAQSAPPPTMEASTPTALETCPSCGLQAPGKLLAEHFLGSPSHRDGPAKVAVDVTRSEPKDEFMEDESQQSVRNLLQILVPPRAFGRRHAHRSVSPVSSIVQDSRPGRRHF